MSVCLKYVSHSLISCLVVSVKSLSSCWTDDFASAECCRPPQAGNVLCCRSRQLQTARTQFLLCDFFISQCEGLTWCRCVVAFHLCDRVELWQACGLTLSFKTNMLQQNDIFTRSMHHLCIGFHLFLCVILAAGT